MWKKIFWDRFGNSHSGSYLLGLLTDLLSKSTLVVRRVPMWQQSGTLLFGSCHGIARFLVDESQIQSKYNLIVNQDCIFFAGCHFNDNLII